VRYGEEGVVSRFQTIPHILLTAVVTAARETADRIEQSELPIDGPAALRQFARVVEQFDAEEMAR
jgi:hypothetical protein